MLPSNGAFGNCMNYCQHLNYKSHQGESNIVFTIASLTFAQWLYTTEMCCHDSELFLVLHIFQQNKLHVTEKATR